MKQRLAITIIVTAWALAMPFVVWRVLSIPGQIQSSRLAVCKKQNRHHDHTITILEKDFKRAEHEGPTQKAIVEKQKPQTLLIIDAALPHENCTARIQPH